MRLHVLEAALVAIVAVADLAAVPVRQAPAQPAASNPDRQQDREEQERAAFAAALPRLRELAEKGDWDGLCRALTPFATSMRHARPATDELSDQLYALREMMGVPPRAPTDAGTKGLVADTLGADAAAAVHYREHIDHPTREVWGDRSLFAGYLATFAIRRNDLDAARSLLVEQLETHRRTRPDADPAERAPIERRLKAVDELRAAPKDPWRRLAFLRVHLANTFPPCVQIVWEVRRELQLLAASPAAADDAVLRLAVRCEEFLSWHVAVGESTRDTRALPVARSCVDGGLVAAAGKRTDVADPWSPVFEMGSMLQRAGDPARAVLAFDPLIACAVAARAAGAAAGTAATASPIAVPNLVHYSLVAAAECKIALGRHAEALADLARTEREFPFETDCGTCRMGQQARIAALRTKAEAGAKAK